MGCGDPSPASVIVDPATGMSIFTQTQLDAFGNIRVSEPQTLFDSKQVFDADLLNFDQPVSGGGTVVYQQQRSSSLLTVPVGAGSSAIRQTKRYFNYQPGKSQRIDVTFVPTVGDPTASKEAGLYDGLNGLFFRQTGDELFLVRRSDVSGVVVDEVVPQSEWNEDKLDGSGPSGATLNPLTAQLMRIDFEWLGVGPARMGFAMPDHGIVIAHVFKNVNTLSSVYMRTPNLPIRYAIVRNALGSAPATLEAICCTVVSEGGQQLVGNRFSADRGTTSRAVGAASFVPLIAIRLKGPASAPPVAAINLRRTVQLLNFSIASLAAGDTSLYRLLINPTRGAGTAPTWTSAHASSSVEYDVSSTQVITGGVPIDAGYAQGRGLQNIDAREIASQIGGDFAGAVADELVLAAQSQTGTNQLLASMSWLEL